MCFKGTLVDWKDDRGFGFIEPAEGGARIFCHLKAFEVRVRRPIPGDKVTYEVGKDAQGRVTAVKVRPVGLEEARYQSNVGSHRNKKEPQTNGVWSKVISVIFMAIIAFSGLGYFQRTKLKQMIPDADPPDTAGLMSSGESQSIPKSTALQCDGRVYCSEMLSKAEAEFFINNCPGTKMDGDNDGEPCENDSRF